MMGWWKRGRSEHSAAQTLSEQRVADVAYGAMPRRAARDLHAIHTTFGWNLLPLGRELWYTRGV